MEKVIICTVCPRGCHMTVNGEGDKVISVEGYSCRRGLTYANTEFVAPVRILTTIVKMENGELLPVRSEKPLPKEKLFDCMEVIKSVTAKAPVKVYDVIVKNICDTGIDIVSTKNID